MEKAYCCFNSNAPDFARIGQLYLDSGKWNGNQLINQEFVMNSIVPADLADEGGRNQRYGYAWWLTEYKGMSVFYMQGMLGQFVICVPDKKLIISKLSRKRRINKGTNHYPIDVANCIEAALTMYK